MICACMFREATIIVSQAIVVFRAACTHGSDTLCKTALIHPFAILLLQLLRMTSVTFDPQAGTRDGELPPWEVAKAVAFPWRSDAEFCFDLVPKIPIFTTAKRRGLSYEPHCTVGLVTRVPSQIHCICRDLGVTST